MKHTYTEEEKAKLFQAIKDNGYKWNAETNTLEKLVEPYKEETMKDYKVTGSRIDFSLTNKIELDLGDTHEVVVEDGKTYVVRKKPQYPTTYEECAKILNCFGAAHIDGYKCELLEKFQELLVCRDAYWKIAEDWKPDYMCCDLYCIGYAGIVITWKMQGGCRLLAFPTEEMRDAFYENFKELIDACKELL